ncbi:MAG: tRNA pseudouridine(55) synthase TruB [Dehalococcoidia bacterium]|nr:tRNA pseudouridine(55) synthase TruB [Dehalococcoidia bacterium]
MGVNGILNIHKPAGMTSFDVVAAIRRITGEKRVGHGGTLDPLAMGVLPVCLGRATRVVEYLIGGGKAYCAMVALGVTTDTDDTEGRITAEADASGITQSQFEQTMAGFLGKIQQVPPKYSAIKIGGRKLYELARAGTEVNIGPRPVEIFSIKLLCFEAPVAVIEVECSKGTYIRSLARDIGQALGVGGHLHRLVRTRSGAFSLDDAVTLGDLTLSFEFGYWRSIIYPEDQALRNWPAMIVGPERERELLFGRPIPVGTCQAELHSVDQRVDTTADKLPDLCAAYGFGGQLIAVLRLDKEANLWRPYKVFSRGD